MSGERLGLLGGTFDPCHNGHLLLAEAAAGWCGLNRVELIPAALPPHKQLPQPTPFVHRAAMIRLAIQGHPRLALSEIESRLPVPSYTVDTLTLYRQDLPPSTELYFIIGKDAFSEIRSWKEYRTVLGLSHFIIFDRDGYGDTHLAAFLADLGYHREGKGWFAPETGMRVHVPPVLPPSISSSTIRERVEKDLDITGLTPGPVVAYIKQHQLYQARPYPPSTISL